MTRLINVSVPGLVRTEADELTYPLHILIRYEIEKMMADKTLDYDHLPEIWADKYEEYLESVRILMQRAFYRICTGLLETLAISQPTP